MKIPLSWLREYVPVTLAPAQLVERLTSAGLEVAGVRVLGLPIPEGLRIKPEEQGPVWDRDKIVIAEVLETNKHPDADRLKMPTVAYGDGRTKVLVTGAPNIQVGDKGQKVVLALTGSKLFDGHSDTNVIKELKPTKIRGVPSDAMVCSNRELGIAEDHEGIIILENDAPVGTPFVDVAGDVILEVDVLPNMARCLAMVGVAREVAALTGQTLKLPVGRLTLKPLQKKGAKVEGTFAAIAIAEPNLSRRYAAALLRGVTVGTAPSWMRRRLMAAGIRSINNIVDITNFVMLEWGQPLHAFDYDALVRRAGGKPPVITVRPAQAGETLSTLDGQKRELTPDHLLIADSAGPIALAGVMGGAETEVTPQTKNILLESANFDFVSIRRTMKHFNLPSEASLRFSRGVHPEMVQPALERAAELMQDHAQGQAEKEWLDCYPAPLEPQTVDVDLAQVNRLLGMDLPKQEAVRILQTLEFGVEEKGDRLRVTVPAHRLDVQTGQADIIEELVRIYGYDRLPATLLADRLPRQRTNVDLAFEEQVRDLLVGCGLQEVITYALTMPEKEKPLMAEARHVELKNPISSERSVMRTNLLPGVLEVAALNLRHTNDVRLFELGFVYLPQQGQTLPAEPRRLALVLTGQTRREFWGDAGQKAGIEPLGFFDLKGIVEALAAALHWPEVSYQKANSPYLHPGKAARLSAAGKELGVFGELHPRVAQEYGLGERTVLVADFDVDAMQAALPVRYPYEPVPRFPAALRDIAVVVDEAISAERVVKEIKTAGGNLLSDARLFDVYRGDSIPQGTKSLAYALSYLADDRTLTDKEVDKAHKKIEERMRHVLKATIRGQE